MKNILNTSIVLLEPHNAVQCATLCAMTAVVCYTWYRPIAWILYVIKCICIHL